MHKYYEKSAKPMITPTLASIMIFIGIIFRRSGILRAGAEEVKTANTPANAANGHHANSGLHAKRLNNSSLFDAFINGARRCFPMAGVAS